MNALQRVGVFGSILCVVVAMVGAMMVQNSGAEAGSPPAILCGVGIVGLLVCLLVFGVGRMTARK